MEKWIAGDKWKRTEYEQQKDGEAAVPLPVLADGQVLVIPGFDLS